MPADTTTADTADQAASAGRLAAGAGAAAPSLFRRFFAAVSLAEGVSFLLLLFVAMPLKYAANLPVAVMVMGSVHGVLFIAYVLLALDGRNQLGWSPKRLLWVLVLAVLPTGAFFAERSVKAEIAAQG